MKDCFSMYIFPEGTVFTERLGFFYRDQSCNIQGRSQPDQLGGRNKSQGGGAKKMTFFQRYSHPKVFSEKLTGLRPQPLTEFSNFKQKILHSNALFIKKKYL